MSRLTDLIQVARRLDPQLGADLEAEIGPLQSRLPFGLNFERHQPEAVELPGHQVRKGSKVRILPPRGSVEPDDTRLWSVTGVSDGVAALQERGSLEPETADARVEDLVTVAEFRDPIYPGLISTGRIERGEDKPFHTVINGENFHALETLLFTHRGKIDAIYIDPPYNTGARDWKYNNDYVEDDDLYRHSKWLAFMERRLKLAKKLLRPTDSVLIVTIDEKEYLRLGLLLEQTFDGWPTQMISSVINPRGVVRANEFSRSNEFIFFVWAPGTQLVAPGRAGSTGTPVAWETMRRRSLAGRRGGRGPGACGPNQFFAIHVDELTGHIVGRGDPLPLDARTADYQAPEGCIAVFPARDDGTEMNWSLTDAAFDLRWPAGYVKAGKAAPDKPQKYLIQYVLGGVIEDIESGHAEVTGRAPDGSVIASYVSEKSAMPQTQWNYPSHNAQENGTGLLKKMLPDRRFPYAKSLFAVEDALQVFIAHKPDAVVLDFFAGSGTTAHAVMRLNHRDGGRRQSIVVTNNEVSADEHLSLRQRGLRPGDSDWEARGICDYITKPRIRSAISGLTPADTPIEGDYRFNEEFSMADGLKENAEFFTLTYESPFRIAADRAFEAIAPMLWLRAGAEGRRIETLERGWDVADTYGIIRDLDRADDFIRAVTEQPIRVAFLITDDERRYQMVSSELDDRIERVRLYEDYLSNFAIVTDA